MRKERERANRRYAAGTAGVIGVLLAISVTVWALRPADLDAATLCPTSRPIEGHTVVIVDRSDRWSPAIGATLSEIVENAQRETEQYQKFSIVSLDADQSVRPLFSVCNPGAPGLFSDLYRGRRFTTRDFDERFVGAAENIVDEVREPSEAQTSPIVEYVHRWLGADDFNAATPGRRLVLVSDMRQNSPLYSLYREHDGEGLGQVVERQFGPAAQGLNIDVYFVAHGRDGALSEEQVRAAWDRAFSQVGANYSWRQIN